MFTIAYVVKGPLDLLNSLPGSEPYEGAPSLINYVWTAISMAKNLVLTALLT